MEIKYHYRAMIWISRMLRLAMSLTLVGMLTRTQLAEAGSPEQTPETVITFVISNEAPGLLVNSLIFQGHGNDTLLQVLDYLRGQSGGVISDAFYNQVASAPVGSEVFTAYLRDYEGLIGGIEIAADGTVSIPSVEGKNYVGMAGYSSLPSQNDLFTFTYAQDAVHYIYTHTNEYGGGAIKNYYAFGIAWRDGYNIFLPLVVRN